jgi:hypothetical protein
MLPPIPVLADYGISPEHGFLPPTAPLRDLHHPYYAKWESIVSNLHALVLSRRLRATIDCLPVLSTSYLRTDAEWRRAYVVLTFMLHGYIWGGDIPAEVRGSFNRICRPFPNFVYREYPRLSASPYWRFANILNCRLSPHTLVSAYGTTSRFSPTNRPITWKTWLASIPLPAPWTNNGSIWFRSPLRHVEPPRSH